MQVNEIENIYSKADNNFKREWQIFLNILISIINFGYIKNLKAKVKLQKW